MNKTIIASKNNIKINDDKYIKVYYKEAILEVLKINKNINKIIIYKNTPGEIKEKELIEKIKKINKNIKIELKGNDKKEKIGYKKIKNIILIDNNKEILNLIINKIIEKNKDNKIILNKLGNKKIIKVKNNNLITIENKRNNKIKYNFLIYYRKEEKINIIKNKNIINKNYLIIIKINNENLIKILKILKNLESNKRIICVYDEINIDKNIIKRQNKNIIKVIKLNKKTIYNKGNRESKEIEL